MGILCTTARMIPIACSPCIARVEYKIAYICLCVENTEWGRGLKALNEITAIDPENVQYGYHGSAYAFILKLQNIDSIPHLLRFWSVRNILGVRLITGF